MIWDHDRYVKESPRSSLQRSNNGLTIFCDMRGKAGGFWASKQIWYKMEFPTFWCLDSKYRPQMFRNQKTTFETYLEDASWNMDFEKMKFFS